MDLEALKPFLAAVVRHGLTTFGGYLVASGIISNSEVAPFVGAGMVLAGIAWSWFQKRGVVELKALAEKAKH